MTLLGQVKTSVLPKLRHVGQFLVKQGIAMVGNLLYGLLCVRILPVPDYAKFAVLFGYMGTLTVLLDVGTSNTLMPLVGEQVSNLQLIANYVTAIRSLAQRLYLIVAPLAAIGFFLLVERQHWGAFVVGQMVVVLLVTAWFARVSSAYGAVLLLRRDRSNYYRIQIIGSLGSLALLVLFWAAHAISIYVCILLNVAQIIFMAFSYFRRANKILGTKGVISKERESSIIRLALPNLPGTIFYAIQGQVTLMLITVFGHSASSVANVGALSRLSQILAFASQMNPILVEPFFARLPASRLKKIYLLSVACVVLGASAFTVLAYFFPGLLLWILGPHYQGLRVEVGMVILASSVRFVTGFMWMIHSSRRFVYWWFTISNIISTLLVQIVFIWKVDLSTVYGVLLLNIATALIALALACACGAYGFWRGPQEMERSPA